MYSFLTTFISKFSECSLVRSSQAEKHSNLATWWSVRDHLHPPDRLKRCPMERDQPMLWIRGLYMWHQKSSVPSSHSSYTRRRRPPITWNAQHINTKRKPFKLFLPSNTGCVSPTCSTRATRVRHRWVLSTTSTLICFLKGTCMLSWTWGGDISFKNRGHFVRSSLSV